MMRFRDFPGSPVVKNPPYIEGNVGLIPGQGTKILHEAVGRGQLSPHASILSPHTGAPVPH